MQKLWLLGDPVAQSRSPVMHNAAYAQMGLDWRYEAARVGSAELPGALDRLRAQGALGANLTIPHKEAVLPLLSRVSERAREIGAVNTLKFDPRIGWEGDNTDGSGWLDSWDEEVGQEIAGRCVIVIGAGGAARSILWALRSRGAERITLLNRHQDRAEELNPQFGPLTRFASLLEPGSIVVQTTSVGMWPWIEATPVEWPAVVPDEVVACDLVYNPRPTLFLKQAAALGAATLDGLGMLIHQAARGIRWWSGRSDVPTHLMREAAEQA